jgi:hypothetical protein
MAKYRLQEAYDLVGILDAGQALDPGTYIHDLGSNESHDLTHGLRREPTGEHHDVTSETNAGLVCDGEIERDPTAPFSMGYP